MRYFLDAEFNGFGGELISLALVPERDGLPPFYEAIHCAVPTEWVAQNVMPVLETTPLTREEVGQRFADYLTDDPDPHLVADWPEDISHAARLLITDPGEMHPIRSIRFELVDPNIYSVGIAAQFPHNAYHDALALREAVLGYERRMAD
jgi:hypothetical protein